MGFFPGISAGWRMVEENFMSGTRKWLSELKPSASYGEVGNQSVDPYQTAGRLALHFMIGTETTEKDLG